MKSWALTELGPFDQMDGPRYRDGHGRGKRRPIVPDRFAETEFHEAQRLNSPDLRGFMRKSGGRMGWAKELTTANVTASGEPWQR